MTGGHSGCPGPRWPSPRSGAGGGMGSGPYSCAEAGSLAPAWPPPGAGSREGSRHLHFRRLFSGAGEKPRSDEIVTKETRETGLSSGQWGAAGKGEEKAFCKAQGPRPPLAPKNLSAQHAPARLGGYNPKWVRTAQETQPFLPLLQGWAALSPLICRRSPQDVRQTPERSSYAGSHSPMQGCVLTHHGAAGTTPGSGKDRGTAGW